MAQLLRSPYYYRVTSSSASAAYVTIYLSIYNGATGTAPATPQYTLTKDVTIPSSGNRYATFEVAELIRDYINIAFDGTYSCDAVWVSFGYSVFNSAGGFITAGGTTLLFLDGYGYFEEGANPASNSR